MSKKIAQTVSFITNPIFILFPIPYLLVYRFGYGHTYAIKWMLFSFIFLFLAGIFVIYEVKHKVFSDMDVSRREQRPLLFGMIGLITTVYMISLSIFKAPPVLFISVLGGMIGIIMASLVNMRVKASLHVASLTTVLITLVRLYSLPFYIFLLIPIVGWARIQIKRHTEEEVVIGFFLGIALTFLMYILLKYIYTFSL